MQGHFLDAALSRAMHETASALDARQARPPSGFRDELARDCGQGRHPGGLGKKPRQPRPPMDAMNAHECPWTQFRPCRGSFRAAPSPSGAEQASASPAGQEGRRKEEEGRQERRAKHPEGCRRPPCRIPQGGCLQAGRGEAFPLPAGAGYDGRRRRPRTLRRDRKPPPGRRAPRPRSAVPAAP